MSEGATSVPSTAGPAPLVSVGMPVHNGAAFLQEAIDSVLRQDYPNLELVICDNASEDGTEAICRHAASSDPRVRYLRNGTNIGLVGNFRRTLDEARGRYFTWLAHDDVLSDPADRTPRAGYLEDHPEAVLCACAVRLLNSEYGVSGEVIDVPELAPEKWPAGRNEFFRLPHGWDGL
ncbi:MAG TPA: glycosyltransferase family 2 protein, partial [Actinomycetota bacterium]|nr:glycosyltransferase family 2 protein [Actinomycetota bacterium]